MNYINLETKEEFTVTDTYTQDEVNLIKQSDRLYVKQYKGGDIVELQLHTGKTCDALICAPELGKHSFRFLQNHLNGSVAENTINPCNYGYTRSYNAITSTSLFKIVKKIGEIKVGDPKPILSKNFSYSTNENKFKVYLGEKLVIKFAITGYPSCCGSVIFHSTYLVTDYVTQEVINRLHKFSKLASSNVTVIVKDHKKKKCNLFELAGFEVINTWKNSNTGNTLRLYSLNSKK